MKERNVDVLLLTGNSDEHPGFWYLCGGHKFEAAMLVWKRGGKKLLIVGDMERDGAKESGLDWIPRSKTPASKLAQSKNPKVALLSWLLRKVRAKGRVALYGATGLEDTAWLGTLKRELKKQGCVLVSESVPLLREARRVKSEEEVEKIREAGVGTREAFDSLQRAISRCHAHRRTLYTARGEALTIGDLKQEVNLALARRGLVNIYGSIVAQGEEGGVPHNSGTNSRKVKTGLPIVCDIFPKDPRSGYYFDMSRTFVPGKASAAQKKAYEDVRQAAVLGFEAWEPGISFRLLHRRVQNFLEEKGYETLHSHPGTQVGFCHGLGHGLGLEVHEDPFIRGDEPLVSGEVITIEPGVYYPERKLGIRIEDVALVTDAGLENLTNYPTRLEVPLRGKARSK
ncbi:MAG: Xaa-Pro peptidase family protein [Candidatus Krumholzibacteria bacterium]|nr:Xaa-Pro peptidase family protein [Candidatus Krumholzibacteria bacterium]MDP6668565.1 Xaa-Pro peptidase family protein [Candidatus Krumholzibacteria bacterium]